MTEPTGTVSSQRIHTGRVVTLNVDQVRFPDGRVGEQEIVRHTGASVVVPFLSDPHGGDPQLLLVKQYRYATNGYLLELPAGRPNPGETPEECAARELREETGCVAEHLEPLVSGYTTPGFTDEKLHLFVAHGITRHETEFDVDEYVEAFSVSMSKALQMVRTGEIEDLKTAFGVLYVAGFYCKG
ncbi:MAG: NUDIX hydrolase [Gemmatimonadaceae bacterium]